MGEGSTAGERNPLLARGALPRFDAIGAEHVEPGIRALLDELVNELATLEQCLEAQHPAAPSWEDLVEPMERLGDRLALAWGTVGHLMGVANTEALRAAHDAVQAAVVEFSLRLGQSPQLYASLGALMEGPAWRGLDAAQQRIVNNLLRDARHAGVGLEGSRRDRFNAIQQELAELGTRFGNHVLDATKAYALLLRDPGEVEGLPESWRNLAAQSAADAEEGTEATASSGPWRVTLDHPSLGPFLQHCRVRALREAVYRAFVTRASDGELDNGPVLERILELRSEEAGLLGYESYAELSLATKMAPSVSAVETRLEELRDASWNAAVRDLAELREHARACGAPEAEKLRHWDIAFWAERLREHRFAYSEEELRPYFPFPQVLEGLFALSQKLFGIRIRAADGETPVWCEDVRFFRVVDAEGEELAAFYLDPYSRPGEKRGGAWMGECVGRSRCLAPSGSAARLPVAYLVCNQTPPVGDAPSLMSFGEVETLFHEFGHGLQHMLTRVDYGLASGIRNIEWDAVELPSQFMENWCYHRETLGALSGHFETGEPLPDELFGKLKAARTYRAGSDMLRQLFYAFTDLELHSSDRAGSRAGESAVEVQRRVAKRTTILEPLPEDRLLCSFGHIFAGGYAAGYYSYKWAEILSADAFEAFEEAGLDDEKAVAETGRRFRDTVLALGGSRDPMWVFERFRDREPEVTALLRHSGLLEA